MDPVASWVRRATEGERPRLSAALLAQFRELPVKEVARLAERHRVTPWLYAALSADQANAPPPEQLSLLQAITVERTVRTLAQYASLATLLAELGDRAIDTVVLKGPAIADRYYPDPALRPYGDVDLLLHSEDVAVAADLLLDAGYEEKIGGHDPLHPQHGVFQRMFFHPARQLVVELHVDHFQVGLRPVGIDDLWTRSVEVSFEGMQTRALEPNDLFVYLCVHLHRHGFDRLIWFKDLDLMMRREQLDWDVITARAAEEGYRDSVAYTIELTSVVLRTPLPAGARAIVEAQPRLSRWLQRLVWRPQRILDLRPRPRRRLQKGLQFSTERGLVRGGLPSLLFSGRRADRMRVLAARLRSRGAGRAR